MKIVSVQIGEYFKVYDFFTDLEDLKEGDKVVADTANGLVIATVVGYIQASRKATKWVVQKIDLEAHQQRMEVEKAKAEIMQKMIERQKQVDRLVMFKMTAASDPEMAALLEQFQQLKGGNE